MEILLIGNGFDLEHDLPTHYKDFLDFCDKALSKRKNEAYVGRVEKVLVDGVSKNDETTLSGRCDSSKIVNFKGDKSLIGKYIDVRITEAHTWSLNGEIAE